MYLLRFERGEKDSVSALFVLPNFKFIIFSQ